MMKRTVDVIGAVLGLMFCAPLFVVAAILIKSGSRGPVFYRQTRVGRDFQQFSIWKFRTMVDSASQNGLQITVDNDSRMTRVGRFLRKHKLDELPQLINVLQGTMSLVGPRPEVPRYVELFKHEYGKILTVRPGITDLASLKFVDEAALLQDPKTAEAEYIQRILPEKMRLANAYIEHASIPFDIAVIIQTVLHLVGCHWAVLVLPELQPDGNERWIQYRDKLKRFVLKWRRPLIVNLDLSLIIVANYLAFLLRFDGNIPSQELRLFTEALPWLVVIRGIAFSVYRLNEGLWRYTSVWDLQRILTAVFLSALAFYIFVRYALGLRGYPQSIFVIDAVLLVGFLAGIRLPRRLLKEKSLWRQKKKVLLYGAGDWGESIVREMKTDPGLNYEPIGFVDDDPALTGQRIHGIQVLGPGKQLSTIVPRVKPDEVLLTMPHATPVRLREITTSLEPFKVTIKTVPNIKDLLENKSAFSQIRNLALEDLLPRAAIDSKPSSMRHMVVHRRILVTGAGGSIGSELCRQIAELNPETIILYERHENSLYQIANELTDRGYSAIIQPIVGDIIDTRRLHSTLEHYRPHVLFHAAAHKHVPLMESNAVEAVKNNCLGTRIAALAADRYEVGQFVLISTDKAVKPSSVMGATKRVAELVVRDMATRSNTRFVIVRFGNVLGSNGSVVLRFQDQIRAGGPVTVTHPQIRRYFMLISEAVHLVLQAAALGEQGATYVLDMGEQIKVLDLARNLIRLSGYVPGKDIPIQFVGLRPGEKLYEELVGDDEETETTSAEKVLQIRTGPLPDMAFLTRKLLESEEAAACNSSWLAIQRLRELVPAFQFPAVPAPSAIALEESLPPEPARSL